MVPEWRFVIRKASSDSTVGLCTNRGLVDSGGMFEAGVESWLSLTQG